MGNYSTDFGEYRTGRFPADWLEMWRLGGNTRVECAFCDSPRRNFLRMEGAGGRSAYVWLAPSADPLRPNQESLTLFRWSETASNRAIPMLRIGGSAGLENAYRLNVYMLTGDIEIDKVVSGVATSLGTANRNVVKMQSWIWLRFRANGTTIQCKIWADNEAEPGAWDISVVDASLADGQAGLGWVSPSELCDVKSFTVATGGATAVPAVNLSLLDYISNPEIPLEMTVRCEYYNSVTRAIEEFWESTHPRETGAQDYPASVKMQGLLIPSGQIALRLSAGDPLSPGREITLDALRFNNLPVTPGGAGPLDAWNDYSFYGRPVEVRIGPLWSVIPQANVNGVRSDHRRFEIVNCSIPSAEPKIGTGEVTMALAPPTTVMKEKVPVRRYIGIPTGVQNTSAAGWIRIPSHASYTLLNFTVYVRIFIPVAGTPGAGFASLTRRQVTATRRQWHIALYQASNGLAHTLHFLADRTDGVNLVNFNTTTQFNVGRFVDIIFAVKAADRWYAIVDGNVLSGGVLNAATETAAGQIVEVNRFAQNLIVCDHRIENFVPEDEAIQRFSAVRTPDLLTISSHYCDDNLGSTVTDYAPTANHAAAQGTITTDYIWSPTYLGSRELAGKEMPISGGVVFHAPTEPIDSTRDVHRLSDRARSAAVSLVMRARGVVMSTPANYVEPADGPGTIDVAGAAADQPLTFQLNATATPDSPTIHIAQLTRDELFNRGGVTHRTCDSESFTALRKNLPVRGGFFYDSAPTIEAFLADMLGEMATVGLDRNGRISASLLTPPINPGPYGNKKHLEFVGYNNRGVILSADAGNTYALNQSAGNLSVDCWFTCPTTLIDRTVSSTFTHFPGGYTLVERYSGTSGFYLGIDGRNGNAIFATIGLVTSGRHYISLPFTFIPGASVWLHGEISGSLRILTIGIDPGFGGDVSETVTGAYVPPVAGQPLRIGCGPAGSFPGMISWVCGSSPRSASVRPSIIPTIANRGGTPRFFLPLDEGSGDFTREHVQGKQARIDGARWAPRVEFDFRNVSESVFDDARRSVPAALVEVQYFKNYAQLTGTNLAPGVSASDRITYGSRGMSVADPRRDIKANYLNSQEVHKVTPLALTLDAELLLKLIRQKLAAGRKFGVVKDWTREVLALNVGDEVLVYHPRYSGFTTGRAMRVIANDFHIDRMAGEISLWG